MASKASILAIMDSNRARLGFGRDKSFVPTPNARNPLMMQEADAFSVQLKDFENAVRDYHRRVQGILRGLLPILDDNLPRVWLSVDEASGLAEPVRAEISHGHPSRVGGDYNATELHRHLDRLDRGLQEDVLLPLKRWQEGLLVARERMHALDRLRREVDGQRRKSEKKFSRAEAKLRKAYLGAGYGSSSSSSDEDDIVPKGRLLEDYHRLALHTERQLRALMESYEEQERLVWDQLSGLVTDAAWLESYAASTMLKVKEAFQGVALALGPSKQPLPAYRSSAYSIGAAGCVKYGDVGDNLELIAQMSPRAEELARGSVPRAAQVLPYQPLHAKRGLATPLLVAAAAPQGSSQRRLAQEPVPPVDVGASAVPMHALPGPVVERALREVDERIAGPEGSGVAPAGVAHSPMGASPRHAGRGYHTMATSPTVTTPTSMPPTMVQRSTTTPTAGSAGVHAVSYGLRASSAEERPREYRESGYTSSMSPAHEGSAHRGTSSSAAAVGGMGGGSSSATGFRAAAPEPLSESVRAAAATGSEGGSPVPFGHLTHEHDQGFEADTAREGYRGRPRGFGSTTIVEGEVLGLSRGGESTHDVLPARRADETLDSYATPLKEAPGSTMGGTGAVEGRTVGGTVDRRADAALDSYATSLKEAPGSTMGGTGAVGGSTTPLEGGTMGGTTERAVNGTTADTSGILGSAPRGIQTGDGTVTTASEPTSFAISNISSQAGSRPTTPGGSSITDAIRAEIARHSPHTGTPTATDAAAPTHLSYPPAAVNARTGTPTASTEMVSPGGGYTTGMAGIAGDAMRPLGSDDGSEQFVDARSESSRTSSIASGVEPRGRATAAPWGPGQPSPVAGLTKQQQQMQPGPVTGSLVQ